MVLALNDGEDCSKSFVRYLISNKVLYFAYYYRQVIFVIKTCTTQTPRNNLGKIQVRKQY